MEILSGDRDLLSFSQSPLLVDLATPSAAVLLRSCGGDELPRLVSESFRRFTNLDVRFFLRRPRFICALEIFFFLEFLLPSPLPRRFSGRRRPFALDACNVLFGLSMPGLKLLTSFCIYFSPTFPHIRVSPENRWQYLTGNNSELLDQT